MSTGQRLGRKAIVALAGAGLYGVGLVVAGFLVPVYSSESVSSTSTGETVTRQSTGTLVALNGGYAVAVLLVPLVVTLLVGLALLLRPRRGALAVAWTLTGLLGAVNLLAMLSLGIFILPVTVLLLTACVTSTPAVSTSGSPVSP